MATFHCSLWRITHGQTLLLDYGDRLANEPSIAWRKESQVTPLINGSAPFIADRSNLLFEMSFDRLLSFGSPDEASSARLSHSLAIAGLSKDILRIEFESGGGFLFSSCLIESGESAQGAGVSILPHNALFSYQLIATGLSPL